MMPGDLTEPTTALPVPERLVYAMLSRLPLGALHVVGSDGKERHFTGAASDLDASVRIQDPAAAMRILRGAGTGLAEGYMAEEWDTDDLPAVLELGAANLQTRGARRLPTLTRPAHRLIHAARSNSRRGSRRNITYHYDLGTEFYRLWLDEAMTYSSAIFDNPNTTLTEAQSAKWDRMLDLLQPSSKDHLLEVGCGWGGFATHAAKEAGCRVTGITLSHEQLEFARARVAQEGLEGLVDVKLIDYRDTPGTFDAIASIEMFEAVGERRWPLFFRRIRELLEPGGRAALQTIVIAEDRFDSYRSSPDFIQRYIFPGGMLPSPVRFSAVAQSKGLSVEEPHFFGPCYATTLERWQSRFEDALPQVRALGFDERFIRMWRYYLAYCRAGFNTKMIDVMQVRLG